MGANPENKQSCDTEENGEGGVKREAMRTKEGLLTE